MAPTYYDDADIQAMIDEFGRDVTLGATTVKGIVSRVDEEILQAGMGHLLGKAITAVVKTGVLPGLGVGAAITVEGTAYKVHSLLQASDGAVTKILCALEQ